MTFTIEKSPLRSIQSPPLLFVSNLCVSFSLQKRKIPAVRNVSFHLDRGSCLGIVGESGCGKSSIVHGLVGITTASEVTGAAIFDGKDLFKERKEILGKHIGMIFQNPMSALNPTMQIGHQIAEGAIFHKIYPKKQALERAIELLDLVGIDEPHLRASQFPHELSGGMRQRVAIAIALACHPKLLIADEITTALDPLLQAQILKLLKELQTKFQMSLIVITHDLSVVAKISDQLAVVYAGKIVEKGPTAQILACPRHPYTQMLLESRPKEGQTKNSPLRVIEGAPPNLFTPIKGCSFRERCPFQDEMCLEDPPCIDGAACWRLR